MDAARNTPKTRTLLTTRNRERKIYVYAPLTAGWTGACFYYRVGLPFVVPLNSFASFPLVPASTRPKCNFLSWPIVCFASPLPPSPSAPSPLPDALSIKSNLFSVTDFRSLWTGKWLRWCVQYCVTQPGNWKWNSRNLPMLDRQSLLDNSAVIDNDTFSLLRAYFVIACKAA